MPIGLLHSVLENHVLWASGSESLRLGERGKSSLALPGNTAQECWIIGELEYWVQEIGNSEVFPFLAFALLHYSMMTPLPQTNSEIADTMSPLWGQIKATFSGRGFFT